MGNIVIFFDRAHSLTIGGADRESFETIWKGLYDRGHVCVGDAVIFKDNIAFLQFNEERNDESE